MDRVKVFLRIKGEGKENELSFTETSLVEQSSLYEFDKIFCGKSQKTVYESIRPLVQHALNGQSLAVFAYGQTGSGKTYTMEGTKEDPGVILRALEDVFSTAPEKVSLSAIEIYNEKVSDLLVPETVVCVREGKEGVVIDALTQEQCATQEEAFQIFGKASANRKTEDNGINTVSSRSHMVFTIVSERQLGDLSLQSKITLIDLAGSEKVDPGESPHKAKRHRPEKTLETANINKSLFYLSRIIHTLSTSPGKHQHINYRDSKLTFILRDFLNGHSHLAVIGTVNPENHTETKNTIGFLSTAKEIKLTPHSAGGEELARKLVVQVKHLSNENIRLSQELADLHKHKQSMYTSSTDKMLSAIDAEIHQLSALMQKVEHLSSAAQGIEKEFLSVTDTSNTLQQKLFSALCSARDREISDIECLSETE
ncbi:kinesin family member 18/19 [Nematocida sp. AWRm77]|nr:kinesin family member 18/19 [Nematocida sp. AWRm77]